MSTCRLIPLIGLVPVASAISSYFTEAIAAYDNEARPAVAAFLADKGNDTMCNGGIIPADTVKVGIAVDQLLDVNQKAKTIKIVGYFREYFQDHRLVFPTDVCEDKIVLSSSRLNGKLLWDPGCYIENAGRVEMGGPVAGELVRLHADGNILWSRRMQMEMSCPTFVYGQAPWDVQFCHLSVGMYRYTAEEVKLGWYTAGYNGIEVIGNEAGRLEHGEFRMEVAAVREHVQKFATGSFVYAQVCFKLSRESSFFAMTMMIALLLVVATYSGLFVSHEAAPGRISLSFLCFLMVITNFNAVQTRLPPLTNTRRVWLLDFLGGTMIFNFILLLEYAVVNYMETRNKLKRERHEHFETTVRRIFEQFDIHKTGSLDRGDMREMCKALQLNMSEVEVDELIAESDVSGNGTIEFGEFFEALQSQREGKRLASVLKGKAGLLKKIVGRDINHPDHPADGYPSRSAPARDHASEEAPSERIASPAQEALAGGAGRRSSASDGSTRGSTAAKVVELTRQATRVRAGSAKARVVSAAFEGAQSVTDTGFRWLFPAGYVIFLVIMGAMWPLYPHVDGCQYD